MQITLFGVTFGRMVKRVLLCATTFNVYEGVSFGRYEKPPGAPQISNAKALSDTAVQPRSRLSCPLLSKIVVNISTQINA